MRREQVQRLGLEDSRRAYDAYRDILCALEIAEGGYIAAIHLCEYQAIARSARMLREHIMEMEQ